jgi:hypothetical protein
MAKPMMYAQSFVGDRGGDRLREAEPPGDLAQHDEAAVRGQTPCVERGCERLARDGRQSGQERCSVHHDGRDGLW